MRFIDNEPIPVFGCGAEKELGALVPLMSRITAAMELIGADRFIDLEVKLTPLKGNCVLVAVDEVTGFPSAVPVAIPSSDGPPTQLNGTAIDVVAIERSQPGRRLRKGHHLDQLLKIRSDK